jgi:subfamily B ATP-binding cassette protein MsbA
MWFWRIILRLVKPYAHYAALSAFFSLLSVVFSLFSLTMLIPFLDLLFTPDLPALQNPKLSIDPEGLNAWSRYQLAEIIQAQGREGALWTISIAVIVLFFFKNLFRYLANFFMSPLRNKVVMDLRNQMYAKILVLPLAYYGSRRTGDIMSRISGDVQEVEWSVMSFLIMLLRQPIALLIFTSALVIISPTLTLFSLILIPLAGYIISLSGKWLNRLALKGQEQLGQVVSTIEETLGGIRIIKAFNAIDVTNERFSRMNQGLASLQTRVYRQRDLGVPLTEVLAVLAMVSVIWFGGRQVLDPDSPLDARVFMLYIAVFSQVIPPAKSLISAWYSVRKGEASMQRIEEVLQQPEIITDRKGALDVHELMEAITLRDLRFRYEDQDVLNGIDLVIRKGTMVAIVGPSGGGKTTLLNLLPRFYEASSGQILIDGTDIRDIRIDALRGMMGLVSQETVLFNDTVRENIIFGWKGATEDEVVRAAQMARADDFIRELPLGYDTLIGDRGLRLSGGQRQRLALARAILRQPSILLLDEATSALDNQSEREVQEALNTVMKGRTSIVIAHRLSTISEADLIVVLQEGRIVEQGSHQELIQKKGTYFGLWMMQQQE